MKIKGLSDIKLKADLNPVEYCVPVITQSQVDEYLAEKGLVAVNLEDLKRAESMLGWNGSYDITAEILNEIVYKIESAKEDV